MCFFLALYCFYNSMQSGFKEKSLRKVGGRKKYDLTGVLFRKRKPRRQLIKSQSNLKTTYYEGKRNLLEDVIQRRQKNWRGLKSAIEDVELLRHDQQIGFLSNFIFCSTQPRGWLFCCRFLLFSLRMRIENDIKNMTIPVWNELGELNSWFQLHTQLRILMAGFCSSITEIKIANPKKVNEHPAWDPASSPHYFGSYPSLTLVD